MEALESLARIHVGLSGSPLAFVNVNGAIVAVFVNDVKGAIAYASTLDKAVPSYVEDATGVAWDNPASATRQACNDE